MSGRLESPRNSIGTRSPRRGVNSKQCNLRSALPIIGLLISIRGYSSVHATTTQKRAAPPTPVAPLISVRARVCFYLTGGRAFQHGNRESILIDFVDANVWNAFFFF